MRLFTALPVSPAIKNSISEIQMKLKNHVTHEKIKWISHNQMHITLNFLGEINREQSENIKSEIEKAVSGIKAFTIKIKELSLLPLKGNPRVIVLRCNDIKNTITKIKTSLDKSLENLGIKTEKRAFKPHITIGRIKFLKGSSFVIENILCNKNVEFEYIADRIQLIKSVLQPAGPVYEVIYEKNI